MAESEQKARSIADAALALEGEMRDLFVTSACGEDADLLAEVRELVEAGHEDIATARTIAPVAKPATSMGQAHPAKIAHFTIRRVIGSGGMGTVYEGVQDNPRRKVAVKVMRQGVTSRTAQRRFAFESQILARLHHQGIAQIYEAGTYDDGSGGVPWFAMEYIVGSKSLNEYANDKNMGTRDRLRLFAKVCDAVSHGHQKGIIHRDLKPGNILVDANGQPKVIDFGVARATDSDMAVTTLQTDVGQLLGTLQYMSPEQCEADPDLLDTRSDVYSLGVILYELLCDALPYDLESVPVFEAARVIREQAPGRPSTIDRTLRGDVETIVMKALQKDRDHRYQSSHELQRDIERYLDNEPIEARPPSITYQLKIFAKRNRAVFVSISSIAAVLVIATVVSIVLALSAMRSADEARTANAQAEAANSQLSGALEKATKAEEQALRALDVAKVLREAADKNAEALIAIVAKMEAARDEAFESFRMLLMTSELTEDLLALGAPRNAQGRTMSVHDIALQATVEITERFSDIPHLEAPARRAIGMLLWEMGDLENAETQLIRSVEVFNSLDTDERVKEHIQTAIALCKVFRDKGDYDRAREQAQAIIDHPYAQTLGEDSEEILGAKDVLADITFIMLRDDPVPQRREILAAIKSGGRVSREFELGAQVALAESLWLQHNISGATETTEHLMTEARQILEVSLPAAEAELGRMHPISVEARGVQAGLAFREAMDTLNYDVAVELYRQFTEDTRLVFGPRHIETADAATALGLILFMTGDLEESEQLFSEGIDIYTRNDEYESPGLLEARMWMGSLRSRQGRWQEGEDLLRSVIDDLEETFGYDSFHGTNARASLAMALLMQGNFEEGDPLWQQAQDQIELAPAGTGTEGSFRMRMGRAFAYIIHRREGVDTIIEDIITDMSDELGPGDPRTVGTAFSLCNQYYHLGGGEKAVTILESLYEKARPLLPSTDSLLLQAEIVLVRGYWDTGQYEKAEDLFEVLIPSLIENHGPWHETTVKLQVLQARNVHDQGRIDEALEILTELHGRVAGELGEGNDLAREIEQRLIKVLAKSEQWEQVDEIMALQRQRWDQDPDELVKFVEYNVDNTRGHLQGRYLDLALDAAQRVVVIRGQDEPQMTYALATVYLARGEHAEAATWLEITVARAGDDHENIDTYRSTLDVVRELMVSVPEDDDAP